MNRLILTAGALVALAWPAAASGQAQDLATGLPRATVVGAAGGWTAWSAYEGGGYRLVTRAPDGTETRPNVPGRQVPFDLDLGVDGAGRIVAAYSRCTTEPSVNGGANATAPNYATGRGCRVHLMDLVGQTERKLGVSRGSSSDVLPSVGGSRIAFVARPKARRLRGQAELRWRRGSSTTSSRVHSGTVRTGSASVAGGPSNVDTDGTRIASIWRGLDPEFNSYDSVLRVGGFAAGRKHKQVAFGTNSENCNYDSVLAPTLAGTTVTFVETDGASWVHGRTPVNRQSVTFGDSRSGDPAVLVTSAAQDGPRLVVAETVRTSRPGFVNGATTVRQIPVSGQWAPTSPFEFCTA